MPIFTWDQSYSVSISSMDEQHKKLFNLINQLHDAMTAGKGKQVMGDVLNELLEYTRTHFTAEEKVLEKFAYPGLAEQKREHAVFVDKILELQKKMETGALSVTIETSKFLKDWLLNHIQIVDKKYGTFLNDKGQK